MATRNLHNWTRRRDRLMREIREAQIDLRLELHRVDSQGRRARTLAAKRLAQRSGELHRHLGRQP